MSLPSLMSLDRMTVRAPHLALGDFRLGLSKALCVAHIEHLVAKVVGINYGAIDPAQHSAAIGRQKARAQAVDKVYELLGFRLRDELARPVLTEADAAADLAGTPRPT